MNTGLFEELDVLLEALCEERISAEEVVRLEQIVLADRAAARRYVDYLQLHGTLVWDTAKGGEPQIPPRHADQSDVPVRTLAPAPGGGEHPSGAVVLFPAVPGPSVLRGLRLALRGSRRVWLAAGAVALLCAVWIGSQIFRLEALLHGPAVAVSPSDANTTAPNKIAPNKTGPNTTSPNTTLPGTTHASDDTSVNPAATSDDSVGPRQPRVAPRPADALAAASGSRGQPNTVNPAGSGVDVRNSGAEQSPSIARNPGTAPKAGPEQKVGTASKVNAAPDPLPKPSPPQPADSATLPVVAFVDAQLREGWEADSVQPSAVAEDAEWLRRVHLDLVGRIPTPAAVERLMRDASPRKREAVVDALLEDPSFVRHWTTVWTNLLIGRSTSHDAQRTGLQKFLREAFARNRAWNDVVFDLVSAEGAPEENGAAGFLLAHLNNEAVPATAITARVFLGTQVQCTQCHNHPFNDAKQNEFWELHSFFQQTALNERPQRDAATGKMERIASLATREEGGPFFFETRSGLMKAVFPKYGGEQVDAAPTVNRRRELGRILREDDNRQVARAFVNRTWEHFFGAAFTRPVDDMGTHNPPTHPAALDRLTDEFVASGYDAKQLMRWICQTDAYQRTSRFSATNGVDDPAVGNPPLFSRVYVKSMTAEQLYDSLLVATKADEAPKALRLDLDRQRDDWIQQFILDYATEENDEALTFDGTIPQALLVMNSELVTTAVSSTPGTLLHDVLHDKGSESDKIRRLCLAALSRYPTAKEVAALRKMLRERPAKPARPQSRETQLAEAYQDVFWAFLNSNEFVLVP